MFLILKSHISLGSIYIRFKLVHIKIYFDTWIFLTGLNSDWIIYKPFFRLEINFFFEKVHLNNPWPSFQNPNSLL